MRTTAVNSWCARSATKFFFCQIAVNELHHLPEADDIFEIDESQQLSKVFYYSLRPKI